jgi:hypothetical protein
MSHTEQDITTSWTRIQANEQEEEQEEETPTTEFVNHGKVFFSIQLSLYNSTGH